MPAAQPHRIILSTNFGLIISEDDGATWEWTCEPIANHNVILYQQAAAPSQRLFSALVGHGLIYSDDVACSWTDSGGAIATATTSDAFADPTSSNRVFAVAVEPSDGMIPGSVFRSDDSGVTFGPALLTGPLGGDVLGVESAVSDPATVYVAMYGTTGTNPSVIDPILAASKDSGAHWVTSDLTRVLGASVIRIIAVDPVNPLRLFLRVTESADEKLAISSDGGMTFAEPITVSDQLTAFVRLASGTILVGGSDKGLAAAYRSTDGGATFSAWANPPHLRAMAERGGKLFVAADNFRDPFAVGVSTDEGATFTTLLTYDQVKRIKPCVQDLCVDVCDNLAGLTLWPQAVCGDDLPDAGAPVPTPKSGCGCRAAGEREAGGLSAAALATLVLAAKRRRKR